MDTGLRRHDGSGGMWGTGARRAVEACAGSIAEVRMFASRTHMTARFKWSI